MWSSIYSNKFQWNLENIQSGNNKYWQVGTRAVTKENVKETLRTYYENIGEEVVIRVSFAISLPVLYVGPSQL